MARAIESVNKIQRQKKKFQLMLSETFLSYYESAYNNSAYGQDPAAYWSHSSDVAVCYTHCTEMWFYTPVDKSRSYNADIK